MLERSLIIRGPWLAKIFDQGKVWEMRSQATQVRGRIGLIEAGTGCIVGEAVLVDALPALTADTAKANQALHQVDDLALLEKWRFPWVLAEAVRYDTPRPYDHPKGAVIWVKH